MIHLKNRHLLSLKNHTPQEIIFLIEQAKNLKLARNEKKEITYLQGKKIVLIFEKPSTRTLCAFEVASFEQGAHVTLINSSSSQIGFKESIKDTAKVLGRMYDAIEYRGYSQDAVEILAQYSGIPVFNGLTDDFHPTQMLADALTMYEHCNKPFNEMRLSFIGDAQNNIANSLMLLSAKLGMQINLIAPKTLFPNLQHINFCQDIAKTTGAKTNITEDISYVKHSDFIYTDVWLSDHESCMDLWDQRIALLKNYQVNTNIMALAKNPNVKLMHCLPAYHNTETKVGQSVTNRYPEFANGIEVTNDVFESEASVVFDQAENRLHTIKAVLVTSLSDTYLINKG